MGRRRVKVVSVVTAVSLVLGGAWVATARPSAFACGSDWTATTMPAIAGTGGLDDVAAFSATDAWAVGYRFDPADQEGHTLIEHHDGTSWTVVPSPDGPAAPQSLLDGVAMRASDDAWAVGSFTKPNNLIRTLVAHWDGTDWSRIKSPNAGQPANGQLSAVAAVAADDAWAVGSYGVGGPSRTLIQHWDGTSWTVVPSPNKGAFPNSLADVVAVAADDVWAVGTWFTKAFVDRTLILHWDGVAWTRVASPNAGPPSAANDLVSVAALGADDIWAVGLRGLKTLTVHWDGTSWTVVPSPTPGGNADLAGVVAIAPGDVWAVGGFVDHTANAVRTLVEHWDGTSWSVVPSANKGPSDNHLWGISAASGRMLAVGDRFTGGGTGPLIPLSLERC